MGGKEERRGEERRGEERRGEITTTCVCYVWCVHGCMCAATAAGGAGAAY